MELIVKFIALILAVVIHEVAHGYAAYVLGDPTAKRAHRRPDLGCDHRYRRHSFQQGAKIHAGSTYKDRQAPRRMRCNHFNAGQTCPSRGRAMFSAIHASEQAVRCMRFLALGRAGRQDTKIGIDLARVCVD